MPQVQLLRLRPPLSNADSHLHASTVPSADATDNVESASDHKEDASATPTPVAPSTGETTGEGTSETAMEIIVDADDVDTKPVVAAASSTDAQVVPTPVQHPQPQQTYPGGFAIDVCFEASKLPLDVAIFNSARAAGGDEKIRKYLQAVLVIGGTALIPGMGHALESR